MNQFFNRKNFIFTMVLSFILLVFFLHDDFSKIITHLLTAKPQWLLLGVFCMVIYWFLETVIFYLILNKYTHDITFAQMWKLTLATQFFNGITPFSTGGQPFQIYILNNESKMGLGEITSASIQNFIVYQIALVMYCILAMILHFFHPVLELNGYSLTIISIGFSLNLGIVFFLYFVSTNAKLLHFLSTFGLNMLLKLRIVKDTEKSRRRLLNFTSGFTENMRQLKNHPMMLLQTVLLNAMRLTAFYTVSFVVCRSLGLQNISILEAILAGAYTMLITSIVPLPGAAAGAEFGFLIFFSFVLVGPIATAIMLVWRFITYYIGLMVGFLVFFFGYQPKENGIN